MQTSSTMSGNFSLNVGLMVQTFFEMHVMQPVLSFQSGEWVQ